MCVSHCSRRSNAAFGAQTVESVQSSNKFSYLQSRPWTEAQPSQSRQRLGSTRCRLDAVTRMYLIDFVERLDCLGGFLRWTALKRFAPKASFQFPSLYKNWKCVLGVRPFPIPSLTFRKIDQILKISAGISCYDRLRHGVRPTVDSSTYGRTPQARPAGVKQARR